MTINTMRPWDELRRAGAQLANTPWLGVGRTVDQLTEVMDTLGELRGYFELLATDEGSATMAFLDGLRTALDYIRDMMPASRHEAAQ